MPRLEHKMVGEFHVFTSPELPGLFASQRDRQKALLMVDPMAAKLREMAERRSKRDQGGFNV